MTVPSSTPDGARSVIAGRAAGRRTPVWRGDKVVPLPDPAGMHEVVGRDGPHTVLAVCPGPVRDRLWLLAGDGKTMGSFRADWWTLAPESAQSRSRRPIAWPASPPLLLEWAATASWHFRSYYKYTFTFQAPCWITSPGDPEPRQVEAIAQVGGDPGDIYRFTIDAARPSTWADLCYVRTPDLTISDQDGTELIRIDGRTGHCDRAG